jgi:hypothetical protein
VQIWHSWTTLVNLSYQTCLTCFDQDSVFPYWKLNAIPCERLWSTIDKGLLTRYCVRNLKIITWQYQIYMKEYSQALQETQFCFFTKTTFPQHFKVVIEEVEVTYMKRCVWCMKVNSCSFVRISKSTWELVISCTMLFCHGYNS